MRAVTDSKTAALCAAGLRVHSGWAAVVVLGFENGSERVLDRRRMKIIDPRATGAAQPYHFAEQLDMAAAIKHLQACSETSAGLALKGLQDLASTIRERGFDMRLAAVLLSSARPLPPLPKILASHALIHTAEGEFFRQAFRDAFQKLDIAVTGVRESELDDQAKAVLGRTADQVKKRIDGLGKILGPPWTHDQKSAALAAAIALQHASNSLQGFDL